MVEAYREADRLRMKRANAEAHLLGLYVYEAFCDASPILHAFAKKGTKPIPYRDRPYKLFADDEGAGEGDTLDSEAREGQEAVWAEAYMRQMLRFGKNWGKQKKDSAAPTENIAEREE